MKHKTYNKNLLDKIAIIDCFRFASGIYPFVVINVREMYGICDIPLLHSTVTNNTNVYLAVDISETVISFGNYRAADRCTDLRTNFKGQSCLKSGFCKNIKGSWITSSKN